MRYENRPSRAAYPDSLPTSSPLVLLPYGRFSKEKTRGTRDKELALSNECHKLNARHDNTQTATKTCYRRQLIAVAAPTCCPKPTRLDRFSMARMQRESTMPGQCSSAHDLLPLKEPWTRWRRQLTSALPRGRPIKECRVADTRQEEQNRRKSAGRARGTSVPFHLVNDELFRVVFNLLKGLYTEFYW
jgi:hypothetical protein